MGVAPVEVVVDAEAAAVKFPRPNPIRSDGASRLQCNCNSNAFSYYTEAVYVANLRVTFDFLNS